MNGHRLVLHAANGNLRFLRSTDRPTDRPTDRMEGRDRKNNRAEMCNFQVLFSLRNGERAREQHHSTRRATNATYKLWRKGNRNKKQKRMEKERENRRESHRHHRIIPRSSVGPRHERPKKCPLGLGRRLIIGTRVGASTTALSFFFSLQPSSPFIVASNKSI